MLRDFARRSEKHVPMLLRVGALLVVLGIFVTVSLAQAQPAPSPQPQPLPILTPPPPYTPPPTPTPSLTPAPTPVATGSEVPTPSASGIPTPSATPAPSATPSAVPTPIPTSPYRFVYTPSPTATAPPIDAPAILEIDMTDQIIHAPGTFVIRVVTTGVVTTVTLHVPDFGRSFEMPKIGDGQFGVSLQLPNVPAFVTGRHNVEFIAATPNGNAARVTIPLTLER
jgi:hypothetical protein